MSGSENIPWVVIIFGIIVTWSAGLFFPVLIRYVILRKPTSRKAANWIAGINSFILWILGTILYEAYASPNDEKWGGNAVLFFLFWVNRWLLTRQTSQPSIPKNEIGLNIIGQQKTTEKTCPECKTKNFEKAAYCQNCGFSFKNEEIQHLLLKNRIPSLILIFGFIGVLIYLHSISKQRTNEDEVVTTLAGQAGVTGVTNGKRSEALFNKPNGVAVDANGDVYVADTGNNLIRKITPEGVVTTLAGSGAEGMADGIGTSASFKYPTDLAVDSSGNVYVCDYQDMYGSIRKITSGGKVTTGQLSDWPTVVGINGIAADSSGNIFVIVTTSSGGAQIEKITPGGEGKIVAGSGTYGFADGIGTAASFKYPTGIAVDSSGNLFVADFGNSLVRKVTKDGNVSTLAGKVGVKGSKDGMGSAALFNEPDKITVDSSDNVYVVDLVDANTHKLLIRKITSEGLVTTLVGDEAKGFTDGPLNSASFNDPQGVAIDSSGNIYVADSGNNLVRKIQKN